MVGLLFNPEQLTSAIRHLGLTRTDSAAVLHHGSVELDVQTHQVRVAARSPPDTS